MVLGHCAHSTYDSCVPSFDQNTRIAMEKVLTQLLLHPEGRKSECFSWVFDRPLVHHDALRHRY